MTQVDANSDKRALLCDGLTRATLSSVGISAKGVRSHSAAYSGGGGRSQSRAEAIGPSRFLSRQSLPT
jgi:hypothetical protein